MSAHGEKGDLVQRLKLKIAKAVRRGESPPPGLVNALAGVLKAQQNRLLRQKSNERFGKKRARELRKKGTGFLAFPPT